MSLEKLKSLKEKIERLKLRRDMLGQQIQEKVPSVNEAKQKMAVLGINTLDDARVKKSELEQAYLITLQEVEKRVNELENRLKGSLNANPKSSYSV